MPDVISSLDSQITAKHLLQHTFYQRWTDGTLTAAELQEYARQYYHYALAFPTFLSAMHAKTDDLETRQFLLENLIEEARARSRGSESRHAERRDARAHRLHQNFRTRWRVE
jgi:pyrroloquinoline quinone (PQQ) biosynthesis protein C